MLTNIDLKKGSVWTERLLLSYIKQKDYNPKSLKDYFLKLSEEVGELSRAMRKGLKAVNNEDI